MFLYPLVFANWAPSTLVCSKIGGWPTTGLRYHCYRLILHAPCEICLFFHDWLQLHWELIHGAQGRIRRSLCISGITLGAFVFSNRLNWYLLWHHRSTSGSFIALSSIVLSSLIQNSLRQTDVSTWSTLQLATHFVFVSFQFKFHRWLFLCSIIDFPTNGW